MSEASIEETNKTEAGQLTDKLIECAKEVFKNNATKQDRKKRQELCMDLFSAGMQWSKIKQLTGYADASLSKWKNLAEIRDRGSEAEVSVLKKDLAPMLLRKAHKLLDISDDDLKSMSTAQRITAGAIIFDKWRIQSNQSTSNIFIGSSNIEELERRRTKKVPVQEAQVKNPS